MLYISNEQFNINFYTYNQLESAFYEKCYQLACEYPFKWYEFMNKILANQKITFFKDTTMIINLMLPSLNEIKTIFEFLKSFLKAKLIKKIIYKKEYLIVHFFDNKSVDLFKQKNLWMAFYLYKVIKLNYPEIKCYFQGILEQPNQKYLFDLILINDKHTYLINTALQHDLLLNNEYQLVYLFAEKRINEHYKQNYQAFKFTFDKDILMKRINQLIITNIVVNS